MMLDEVAAYIDDLGLATEAVNLFKGSRPDEPDVAVCLYQYPGGGLEYVQESNTPMYEMTQLQVVVRGTDYEAVQMLIMQIWSALSGVVNATLSGVRYRSIKPNGTPGVIGRDTNDRNLLAFNATVDKEVTLATVS